MAQRGKPGQSKPSDDGADGLKLEFAWDPVKAASNLSKHGVASIRARRCLPMRWH